MSADGGEKCEPLAKWAFRGAPQVFLLKTTLEPPSVPWSGFAFAESAAHIYKAMEDSEWLRVSAE